jgi:transcriptional regulator with XRE-family HTH domain
MDIASLIRARRVLHQFSQEELGRLVGCTPAHISFIECGKRKPSVQLLGRLAATLSFDPQRVKR